MTKEKPLVDYFGIGIWGLLLLFLMFLFWPIASYLFIDSGLENSLFFNARYITPRSITLTALAMISFLLGLYLSKGIKKNSRVYVPGPLRNLENWEARRTTIVVIALISIGLGFKAYRIIMGQHLDFMYATIDSPLFFLFFFTSFNLFFHLPLGVLFVKHYSCTDQPKRQGFNGWKLSAWLYFALCMAAALITPGSRYSVAVVILCWLLPRHYLYQRIKLKQIAVFIFVAIILSAVKVYMKDKSNLAAYSDSLYTVNPDTPWTSRGFLESLRIGKGEGRTISDFELSTLGYIKFIFDSSAGRLNNAHIFGIITETHPPDQRTYGEQFPFVLTYFMVPQGLIEKIFRVKREGSEFGKEAGLDDGKTGIGYTNLGDWYRNFGPTGVVLGLFLTGLIFGLVHKNLTRIKSQPNILIYTMLFPPMLHGMGESLVPGIAQPLRIYLVTLCVCVTLSLKADKKYLEK